ncbi:MAG: alpha-L-fucosidase [Bacteroidales bacterium]|nr:alpha-L-fucosidase [Bacteroidales bacterium]
MKKSLLAIALVFTLILSQSCSKEKEFSKTTAPENMEWWDDAKFGMFIHWGVYSRLAGTWEGETYSGYAEHLFRMAQIPLETYKNEVAANFNPVKFNADEWVKICKDAGMKYMVITSKHHDGFAMFDSKVPGWDDYDIVDGTKWGRDPMKELKAACDKQGIRFGFYYSHSQDWSHRYGQRNTWDFDHPTIRGAWYNEPEWKDHKEKSMIYVNEKSIPQLREILNNYDPAIIWFDTRNWLPDEYNQIILTEARKLAPNTIFSSRSAIGFADYQSTSDKPQEFPPVEGFWEAIPTTNNSYGYHADDHSHKPSSHFIKLLSKASARGGNLLMNVGPMGTGEIAPIDVGILKGIGDWLKVNGEAIYGTERTILPVNAWGESTIKGNTLFLHVFQWPNDGKLIVGGLQSDPGSAYLLADPDKTKLKAERLSSKDLLIHIPEEAPDSIVTVIALECEGLIETDSVRLLASNVAVNTLHVFDGQLKGSGIQFGNGNAKANGIIEWTGKNAYVTWKLRSNEETTYSVDIFYDAPGRAVNNKYLLTIGDFEIEGEIIPGNKYTSINLGEVNIKKGETELTVRPAILEKGELMNLRKIVLTPIK